MIQFADFGVNGKMNARSGKLMIQVLLCLLLTDLAFSEANNRTPARVLAKQTGAAQFEEHIEQQTNNDWNEHHHRLRKRSSDEDLDYEVYQGVVGRPGIDFPIYPRIPQTTFSCRSYGNGYFADLETGCQVFHICEEGRKISFLCPNGTIFQQSELTCDWWFKVNCAGSPSFYVESAEILSKARRQRVRPNKGFTNNNKLAEVVPLSKTYKESERRIDSNENPSVESLDFEDISDDRSQDRSTDRSNDRSPDRSNDRSGNRSNNRSNGRSNGRANSRQSGPNDRSHSRANDKLKQDRQRLQTNPPLEENNHHSPNEPELQITAETGSFVNDARRNSYVNPEKTLNKEREFVSDKESNVPSPRAQSTGRGNQKNDFNDKLKTAKKVNDENPSGFYITARPDTYNSPSTTGKVSYFTTAQPEIYTSRNSLDGPAAGDKQLVTAEIGDRNTQDTHSTRKPELFENGPSLKSTVTSSSYPGTYSTARKLNSTRSTPFYTPTVPSVVRSKPTESKTYFVNVNTDEVATLRNGVDDATPRPIILGMRHDNSEIHRFPLFSNGDLKIQLPVYSLQNPNSDGLGSKSSTSGPTYLPKRRQDNQNEFVTPANVENSVDGNVKGILKMVDVLKETMKTSLDDKNNSPRVGLDIPPSSGPGTLVSLTNYFANSDLTTTAVSSEEEKVTTPVVDISAVLVTNKTSGKYLNLFGIGQNDEAEGQADTYSPATTAVPKILENPTVIGDFSRTTIRDLAQNPETRKIAQVFSNAITKYIEDPETFRKDLIDIRPTEPTGKHSSGSFTTPSPNFNEGGSVTVVTDISSGDGLSKETTQSYLTSTTEKYDTSTNSATESNGIAKEINDQFDVSTHVYDSLSTESTEATTYRGSRPSTSRPVIDASLSSELLPPSHDDEQEHETLHKVQSQSFVESYNDLAKGPKSVSFEKTKNRFDVSGEKTTTAGNPWLKDQPRTSTTQTNVGTATVQYPRDAEKSTENPWTQLITTENNNNIDTSTVKVAATPWKYDGKNKIANSDVVVSITESTSDHKEKPEDKPWTLTQSPVKGDKVAPPANPWLKNLPQKVKPTESPWSQITQSIYLDPLTINDGLMREQKTTTLGPFNAVNTDRSRFEDASQSEEGIDDILNSPELSSESLPRDSGLQRIANKIFGGLNETEAVHLQNVMKKAERNQSVLKLLLLLIQTCDDQNGRALEKSRKMLLNALIGMDGKPKSNKNNAQMSWTTNKIPVTTYRGVYSTVTNPTTTLPSSEGTTKFEIRVADPEEEDNVINTTAKAVSSERQPKSYDNPNRSSDERALELLKSLYSLASKFSRR